AGPLRPEPPGISEQACAAVDDPHPRTGSNPVEVALVDDDHPPVVHLHVHLIDRAAIVAPLDLVAGNTAGHGAGDGRRRAARAAADLVAECAADNAAEHGAGTRGAAVTAVQRFDPLDHAA